MAELYIFRSTVPLRKLAQRCTEDEEAERASWTQTEGGQRTQEGWRDIQFQIYCCIVAQMHYEQISEETHQFIRRFTPNLTTSTSDEAHY